MKTGFLILPFLPRRTVGPSLYSPHVLELLRQCPGKGGEALFGICRKSKLVHDCAHPTCIYSLDDVEVYNNLKNSRPPLTDAEKVEKKKWEAEHPGERYPANWNLSFDYMAGDDGDEDKLDKSRIFAETCTYMETEDESEKEMLDRILWFLTDIQREVYRLVKIVGHTQTEAADILGTSIPNINKHLKKAMDRIETEKEKM